MTSAFVPHYKFRLSVQGRVCAHLHVYKPQMNRQRAQALKRRKTRKRNGKTKEKNKTKR